MAVVGITGGSGLIGRHIAKLLVNKGYEVLLLSRAPAPSNIKGASVALFDAAANRCDTRALKPLSAVIHLAGEPVAGKRWTAKQKDKIYTSRVSGTQFLADQLRQYAPDCRTIICASAIGYYGADRAGKGPFTEQDAPANDFLGKTCHDWEAAGHTADSFTRVVLLRTGIVLAREGGAFKEFIRTLPLRIVPVMGSGKQVISWIHLDDIASMYVYAMENEAMYGSYNAVAPAPISNKGLMNTIGDVHGGFHLMPHVPAPALRLALGEMSVEVLKSCTVSAEKMLNAGFRFRYPDISSAVRSLI